MEFKFSTYDHEQFNHLKFEVLDDWLVVENGLATVFVKPDGALPELHFQTIGKTEDFGSSESFYQFLLKEDPPGDVVSVSNKSFCGYEAVMYEAPEEGYPDIYVYGLIIDVGEGILWFLLKAPSDNPAPFKPILDNLGQTLEFD